MMKYKGLQLVIWLGVAAAAAAGATRPKPDGESRLSYIGGSQMEGSQFLT